jgi:hypothetical protein
MCPHEHRFSPARCGNQLRKANIMNKNSQAPADGPPSTIASQPVSARGYGWLWLSIAAALLAAVGSVVGLAVGRIYAGLTPAFLPQAIAQDIANLAVSAPAMIILAALALRGSLHASLLWLGVVAFTVYNYVILMRAHFATAV